MKHIIVAMYAAWVLLTFLCVVRQAYRQDIEAAIVCFIMGTLAVGSIWLAHREARKVPR